MRQSRIKIAGLLVVMLLVGGCISAADRLAERPNCHSKDAPEECTNFVHNRKLKQGFRDGGFEQAHRKQGYENLREQGRQQRDAERAARRQKNNSPQGSPPNNLENPAGDRR